MGIPLMFKTIVGVRGDTLPEVEVVATAQDKWDLA